MLPAVHEFQILTRFHRLRACLAGALLAAGLLAPALAQLDIPNRRGSFTPGELAMLPPYCRNMQGFPGYHGPEGDRWRSMMGNDYEHIHHYCRGLRDVIFATSALPNATQRRFLWPRAVSEYDYMINNARCTLPLLPEIHFKRGEALVVLGRLAEADAAFARARALKPDYWPAYVAWADQLMSLKLNDRARDLLLEGLRHLPESPELLGRLARLPDGARLVTAARAGTAAASAGQAPAPAASAPESSASAPAPGAASAPGTGAPAS